MMKIQLKAWEFMQIAKRYCVHRLFCCKVLLFISWVFACMYACILCVLVPEEVGRGYEIPLEVELQVAVSPFQVPYPVLTHFKDWTLGF